jgi:DNA-directed RNA polymerase specialized sigma24 family protein
VDLQNIEGDSEARLSVFEKDVLNALHAQTDSPLAMLLANEEAVAKRKQAIQELRRLRRYVKYARLTSKQRRAYELFVLTKRQGLTLRRLARKLKISLSSAWARIRGVVSRLERVERRRQEGRELKKVLNRVLYAGKLRRVFRLYFEKCWPPQTIARSLHSNLSTIYDNLRTIRALGYVYSSKKYMPLEEARKAIRASVEKASNKPA